MRIFSTKYVLFYTLLLPLFFYPMDSSDEEDKYEEAMEFLLETILVIDDYEGVGNHNLFIAIKEQDVLKVTTLLADHQFSHDVVRSAIEQAQSVGNKDLVNILTDVHKRMTEIEARSQEQSDGAAMVLTFAAYATILHFGKTCNL
jgi:hypothetical protein